MKLTLLLLAVVTLFSCEKMDMDEPGYLVPKTVDEDLSLPSITVNGTMLHAEAFGSPPESPS